ncbi:hypothetical protein [Spirosoma sp. KNUC1025]|uniref:hypothetical protein n=1 Tax=Spirosoma sp. KNUC1025 TaxID=2894082 RepID=UPI00386C15CF|nr:hypothetical protein LN737_04965 [Spirosoma sp. KNUC1025]
MKEVAKYLIKVDAQFKDGQIVPEIPYEEVMKLVNEPNIVIIKTGIPESTLRSVIDATRAWAEKTPLAEAPDTFDNNQHKQRLHIAKIQKAPQLFHDHTFDAILDLEEPTKQTLLSVFDPLRQFWNNLTGIMKRMVSEKGSRISTRR